MKSKWNLNFHIERENTEIHNSTVYKIIGFQNLRWLIMLINLERDKDRFSIMGKWSRITLN